MLLKSKETRPNISYKKVPYFWSIFGDFSSPKINESFLSEKSWESTKKTSQKNPSLSMKYYMNEMNISPEQDRHWPSPHTSLSHFDNYIR